VTFPNAKVLHAYSPATENFDKWEGLKRNTPEYAQLKEERCIT
jgi:hypothetical protein